MKLPGLVPNIHALQRQFRLYIPFLGIARPQPNFHIHVSMSDLYIPRIGPHIPSSRKGRPIVGIYNSLTDTWMWKLGLMPRYSFPGNICLKFSAFCLCSVYLWAYILYVTEAPRFIQGPYCSVCVGDVLEISTGWPGVGGGGLTGPLTVSAVWLLEAFTPLSLFSMASIVADSSFQPSHLFFIICHWFSRSLWCIINLLTCQLLNDYCVVLQFLLRIIFELSSSAMIVFFYSLARFFVNFKWLHNYPALVKS